MIMHWPQIVEILLLGASLGLNLAKNGQSRADSKYSFNIALISCALTATILYYGGFWTGGQ